MAEYTDSLYGKVLLCHQETIRDLALEAIEPNEVRISKLAIENRMLTRGISLIWDDPRSGEGSNEENEVGYPAIVSMSLGSIGCWDDNMPLLMLWREKIFETFHDRRPLESLEHEGMTPKICRVDWGSQWLSKPWRDAWDQSLMVIWTWLKTYRA